MGRNVIRHAGPAKRWRGRAAASALLALGAATPLGTSCEPACEQPYRPVGTLLTTPIDPPRGDWPVTGGPRPVAHPILDTDGDGVSDTADLDEDRRRVTIHRSSGDLVIDVPAPGYVGNGEAVYRTIGDLDGDGRTEALIPVIDQPGGLPVTQYVVPGTTPDGTYEISDVAATPLVVGQPYSMWAVGDLDGDRRDDIAVTGTEESSVWLGADLDLTPGLPPVEAPSHVVPGELTNLLTLGGINALSLQTGTPTSGHEFFEVTLWVPQGSLRFTTEGSEPNHVLAIGWTTIYDDGDSSWLVLRATTHGSEQLWAWDFDDLCAGLPAALADLAPA